MAYRDISRGVALAKDHANYLVWLDKDTSARQTAYAALGSHKKTKTDHEAGFIIPFGSSNTQLAFLPARIISATQAGTNTALSTAVATIINPYTISETEFNTKTTAEKANLISGVHQFKFAKLSIKQLVTAATEKKASRITGRLYYRHVTNTVTASFGKIIASDTYQTVCAAIEAEAAFVSLTTGTNKNNHFRFTPEKG